MKSKFFLIVLLFLVASCKPEIKNDIGTLTEIFKERTINLQIRELGCFGGFDEYFVLRKEEDSYKLINKRSGKQKVLLTNSIDSLKSYLEKRIGKENEHFCTISQYLKVGNSFQAVDYYHANCSEEMKKLDDILGYYDLIVEEDE